MNPTHKRPVHYAAQNTSPIRAEKYNMYVLATLALLLSSSHEPVIHSISCVTDMYKSVVCLRPAASSIPLNTPLQPLIQRAALSQRAKAKALANRHLDPYRAAQREERRQRNLARQATLDATRSTEHGDPVQGIPTPFLASLDSAGQADLSPVKTDDEGRPLEKPIPLPTSKHLLNYQLTQAELDEAIAMSYELTKPDTTKSGADQPQSAVAVMDPEFASWEANAEAHEARHSKAVEALRRITTLENASSRDRRHANIRRIVEKFGRHVTDKTVRQKGLAWNQTERFEKIRGGPDTGSSEVQIAILTAKIRVLARMYAGPKGNKDKHNKKNLRVLCHRRQKLLKYMERKERGSGRWEHMIQTLGLSPATWKNQIEIR